VHATEFHFLDDLFFGLLPNGRFVTMPVDSIFCSSLHSHAMFTFYHSTLFYFFPTLKRSCLNIKNFLAVSGKFTDKR